MKQTLQDYQQTLIARHFNSDFNKETKEVLNTVIEEIGEMIQPKITWQRGIETNASNSNDRQYVINGEDQFGNEYEAVGHYLCNDLISVEDVEKINSKTP